MRLLARATLFLGLTLTAALASAQGRPPAPPPPPPPGGAGAPAGFGGSPPPGSRPPGGPGNAPSSGTSGSGSTSSTHSAAHFGPVGRWWDDKSVVHTVGISSQQQRTMDRIFDAAKPAILSSYKSYLAEKAKLDALSKQTPVDQTKILAAIDSVSQAHAALEKANTQMLLEIRAQMTPAQVTKLESVQ